ncbi:MAG: hypothetical protein FWC83_00525, partial [Alphaproteobacteria bacterium]|nr:hypothetical protein [Alphaproteobacteria bacterium]
MKIFCASNPFRIDEALWSFLDGNDFSNDIIFLPSRRAVRSVERMIVEKSGTTILPKLVALGEGSDDFDDDEGIANGDTVSNLERIMVLSKLLMATNENSFANNLPVARDLIRMMDYLENENAGANINWQSLVDEKYAEHFRDKAKFLYLAEKALPLLFKGRQTIAEVRNKDIRSWIGALSKYKKVIVCGSTGSVPATCDLMVHVAGLLNGVIILPGRISGIRNQEPGTSISNPYYAELKFLDRINVASLDVKIIDTGNYAIEFLNSAFDNTGSW